jgi:hypothetical protein
MRPIANDAHGDPILATQIERIENEPFAPSLGRVETIERKTFGCLLGGGTASKANDR